MVYILGETDVFLEDEINSFMVLLSEQRQDKAKRYRFFKDKRLSVLAYLLLIFAFEKEGINADKPNFFYGRYGKPYTENICFNLSHCSGAAAGIISGSECGIDVQDVDSAVNAMDIDVFSESEIMLFEGAENKADVFAKLWSQKEAYCKYLGCGLKSRDFLKDCLETKADDICIYSKKVSCNVWLSACSKEEMPIIKVSAEELREFAVKRLRADNFE